jgi:Mrp family chromosome partitioning ATPase
VWRGPVIAGAVKQFWTDVIWEDVDYMFVDMPPGTGDVPLTVFQSLPVDGIVIVTSPQDLVSMIVSKAVKMANMMHIPVLGFVENYSYLECPDCGKKIEVFGKSHLDEVAAAFDLPVLARLPIDPSVAFAYDSGLMETVNTDKINGVITAIEKMA